MTKEREAELLAEIDRLRKALKRILNSYDSLDRRIARAALEPASEKKDGTPR